jgi:DNA-binding NarL/FixJ family response regulator
VTSSNTGPIPEVPIQVAVVEDHPLYRAAVANVLAETEGFELGAVAESVAQFAAHDQPAGSVVVLDLNLPGVHDAAAVLEVSGMGHRVLVVSAQAGQEQVLGAIAAGARGYLTKDAGAEEIRTAVLTVAAGEAQLDPTVQRRLLETLATGARLAVAPAADSLTQREEDVLREIAAGHTNPEIAARLHVSEATVKTHINHLLAKTACRDRAALVAYAFRTGRAR